MRSRGSEAYRDLADELLANHKIVSPAAKQREMSAKARKNSKLRTLGICGEMSCQADSISERCSQKPIDLRHAFRSELADE